MSAAADHLRHRAYRLRALAARIEATAVLRLDGDAGDDTWRGARPELCRATLHTNQRQLHAAAEELRGHAYLLDRRAAELEIALATPVALVPGC